jgi:hypothetical protein
MQLRPLSNDQPTSVYVQLHATLRLDVLQGNPTLLETLGKIVRFSQCRGSLHGLSITLLAIFNYSPLLMAT